MQQVRHGRERDHLPGLESPAIIPSLYCQEKQDESEDAAVTVKIFVEFKKDLDTKKAKNALDGRYCRGGF